MKKTYVKPQMCTILLHSHPLMLGGSNTVNDYNRGNDITVGDED